MELQNPFPWDSIEEDFLEALFHDFADLKK